MNMKTTALILLLALVTFGCTAPVPETPTPTPAALQPPAATVEPAPSATPDAGPPVSHAMADYRAFDFGAQLCSAKWTNNGVDLPCPGGDLDNSPDGYVALYNGAELGVQPGFPVILTYPAQNTFQGIFGRFPAYKVNQGDEFYTHVDCLPRALCYVEFAFEYYDQNGAYHDGFAKHPMHGMDSLEEFRVDLSPLAGQVIEPVLVLRAVSERASAYGVWIAPVLLSYAAPQ